MATVFGMWDRYEPRPPEHEIDSDLIDFSLWVAEVSEGLDPTHLSRVLSHGGHNPSWPEGSVLRTPAERFSHLPDFPYEPRFVEFEGLRMAYVEAGDGKPILMLHGEPTWGYLYRRMIPTLAASGAYRAGPDWLWTLRQTGQRQCLQLSLAFALAATFHRSLTSSKSHWSARTGAASSGCESERDALVLASGSDEYRIARRALDRPGFHAMAAICAASAATRRRRIVQSVLRMRTLTDTEAAAYRAPFPSPDYQAGALAFPRLVPIRPDHPGAYENRIAIERLKQLELPVLLPWGDADPVLGKLEPELRAIFRNVAPPLIIHGAGHFIQEDAGEEVAGLIRNWLETGQ